MILPVIHIESPEQAVRNALLAKNCGAYGCFLIDHNGTDILIESYKAVRQEVGDWFVGVNDLTSSLNVSELNSNAIWIDNLGIQEDQNEQEESQKIWESKNDELIFGGIAFKYQKNVKDLSKVAKLAMNYCDVITTSGDKTGKPPSLDKIETIRNAIGEKPMAIASGITIDNISSFDTVDYFLVSTGISKSFTELDPHKLEELIRKNHGNNFIG